MAVDLAPGLSRKLKKVLECRTDSPDVAVSLATLDTFYTTNTLHDRRHLRSTIENRSLSINQEFLLAASPALEALDRVEEDVNGLAECCDKIAKALDNCNMITGDIISTTERLEQELESTTQRQEIVSCFLRDYQLSNEEIIALREENLNDNFFKALYRVQEIHTNCKILLRTHHQRAGLELMDMMAVYQEGAYERLCRWVQAECRKLGDSDNTEVSDLLKKAVRVLKERPILFKYCSEEVANMRHNALFRRFISALTRGGHGGLPRPIEVHAHDPLRYVGDMLGWLHQAVASERELVLVLFDPDAAVDTGPTARRFSKDGATTRLETDLTFVLDRIFEGVCRPFKVRVEQILQSQPNLILSYKLSSTLEFYSYTIRDLLGKDTALSNTLLILKDASVDAILNNSLASSLQHAETPSKVFLINCLSAIQQPLLGHEVAEKYISHLASMIETQINILVDNEVDAVLRACSLSDKMSYIQRSVNEEQAGDSSLPLATIEETSPPVISESVGIFFAIITGSKGSLPEFEQMQVPQLRSQASLGVAKALAEVYERIYGAIVDPRNQYPEPKSLLRHPPGQVRTILGI